MSGIDDPRLKKRNPMQTHSAIAEIMTSQRSYSGDAAMQASGWERRQAWGDSAHILHWGDWKPCTEAEARRVTGLRTWEVRRAIAGMTDAQILHLWDTRVGEPTASRPLSDSDKLAFARSILSAGSDAPLWNAYAEGRADEREEAQGLHAAIMNLPVAYADYEAHKSSDWKAGYGAGHHDARHTAAELVSAALSSPSPAREEAGAVPHEVMQALDRMCSPLHESRLSGVTAQEDARCMKVIRDYILRNPREEAGEDARDAARWRAVASAVSELTLMLHYSRPDQRASIVDAAIAAKEQSK
jgi:hypothetical protein